MTKNNQFDPEKCRIFEGITGSRLYGTDTPESDTDYRGVCIPPLDVLLDPFQGFEQKDAGFEEDDRTIYALGKFIKLCADANPNIIELLFIPENKTLMKTWQWDAILANKNMFLSKKIRYTFSGYAFSQLKAIKTHRQYFLNPPKEKPTRESYGLGDGVAVSQAWLNVLSSDAFAGTLNSINLDILKDEYQELAVKERAYRSAKINWDNYVSWRDNRNPARRELEEKFGTDTKHGSHLIRLLTEGQDLLLNGGLTFPLWNADDILAVKNGKYSYDEIVEIAETMDKQFNDWYELSTLPHAPDRNGLTELYLDIIKQ